MTLQTGMVHEHTMTVQQTDTAAAAAGGLPPVLSTPRVVSLLETTAHGAIVNELGEGQTSVGISINIKHMAATPVGMKARFRAELLEIDGRRLRFKVEAWDEVEKIAEGEHERFIIDSQKFIERLAKKQKND